MCFLSMLLSISPFFHPCGYVYMRIWMGALLISKCLDCPQFQVHDRHVWDFPVSGEEEKRFLAERKWSVAKYIWCCNENVKTIDLQWERKKKLIDSCVRQQSFPFSRTWIMSTRWLNAYLKLHLHISAHHQTANRKWKRHKILSWQKKIRKIPEGREGKKTRAKLNDCQFCGEMLAMGEKKSLKMDVREFFFIKPALRCQLAITLHIRWMIECH